MKNTILVNRNAIYRKNNFICVGTFKKYPIYMGIDKLSFVSKIIPAEEFWGVYKKFDKLKQVRSGKYEICSIKVKHYRCGIKITSMKNPDFYLLLSYDFPRKLNEPRVRFELSPQYAKNRDIPNVIKWLKKHIGVEVIDMLLQTSRVTRIDLTLDVHSKRFLRNYYFSIPNARTGRNFLGNEDDCKNNYAIGSQRSSSYLLVYEKLKFQEVEDVYQNNLIVKREHIKRSITRLELRIKPPYQQPLFLSEVSMLENPFSRILIYRRNKIASQFKDFLPYIKEEKSIPLAVKSYLQAKVDDDTKVNRNLRLKTNRCLEKCKSKLILNIDWSKYPDIIDNSIGYFTQTSLR